LLFKNASWLLLTVGQSLNYNAKCDDIIMTRGVIIIFMVMLTVFE